MPLTGGVIAIGIFKGLENYQGGGIVSGLGIKGYDRAKLSYTTFKGKKLISVDNVDMIASEIRILDYKGMLSSFGRVEERVRGIWGTVCAKGSNQYTAQAICRTMGYQTGKKVNGDTQAQQMACENYQGNYHCAEEVFPIHFTNFRCQDTDRDVKECFREMATECTHK